MKLIEEVITEENVQSLGEQIAIIAVGAKARRVLGHLDQSIKGYFVTYTSAILPIISFQTDTTSHKWQSAFYGNIKAKD